MEIWLNPSCSKCRTAVAELDAAGVDYGVGQGHALLQTQLNEVDENDRITHDDSRARNEADHGCGREERAHRRMRG